MIKPFYLLSKILPARFGHALDCVSCSGRTAHKQVICLLQIEWYHLIVKAVAKCEFYRVNKSRAPEIL